MVEERQHEQNDRVLSSRADFGDRDRNHILGMGATEPPGGYNTSIQSTRGSRTQATGACERTRFGTGDGDTELTFARTGTARSARGDGRTGERTQFGKGCRDTKLTFARTGTSRSARGDGRTEPIGAVERTQFGADDGDTELTFACTGSSRSARGDGRTEPTGANEPSFGISAKDNPVRLVLGICPLESNKNRYGRLMGPSKNRSYLSTAQNCRQMIPFRSRYDSWTFTLEQRAIGIETDFSRVP
jgi:hypothetical protein